MLSWDDYDESPKVTPPPKVSAPEIETHYASPEPATRPMPAVSDELTAPKATPTQADSTTQTAAVSSTATAARETGEASPVEPPSNNNDALAQAREAIANLDTSTGLEELEMGAARIEVDDKRMINCRADLNQQFHGRVDVERSSV